MKKWLLDLLDCETIKLKVSKYSRVLPEIYSGVIFCDKDEYFIRRSIPILTNKKWLKKISKLRGLYEALPAAPWRALTNDWVKHMRLIHYRLLLDSVRLLESKDNLTILALGCGWGWEIWCLSRILRKLSVKARIIGTDIAFKPLRLARKILEREKEIFDIIEFCISPAEKIPFKANTFDIVLAIFGSLDHSESYPLIFQEVSRVLRQNGLFVFTVLNRFSLDWLLRVATKPRLFLKTVRKMRDPFTRITIPLPKQGSIRIPTHYYVPAEVLRLLRMAKLTPLKFYSIFSLLPMNFKAKKFNYVHRILHYLDYYGSTVPFLKFLGRYLGVIAKKVV
ncbi:MAG: class I SAM-dependent methyltransferase [Candidatus Njordarchaeales archaeon]